MNILLVVPEHGDAAGGIATFYRHLVPELVNAGCKVDICVANADGPSGRMADPPHVRVLAIEPAAIDFASQRLTHFAAAPHLRAMIAASFAAWERCSRGEGYDIVEASDWGLTYVPWLTADGPPIVVQLHGSSGQVDFHDPIEGNELFGAFVRGLETALLGRADELQTGGRANAVEWDSLLKRPVVHIHPAWSAAADADAVPAAKSEHEATAIVVGRLQSWKGPDVLCAALDGLGADAPNVTWVGGDCPYLRAGPLMSAHLAANFPNVWGRALRLAGAKSRAETAALQAAAAFAIVPSTWDVFNLSAVEAMGAGKVVICSDGAGASELIRHGENGFRFPANDAAALAEMLRKVRAMPFGEMNAIGVRGRATVADLLEPKRIAAVRIERYRQLVRSQRPRRRSHPWLDAMFGPQRPGAPYDFLRNLPLKELAPHVAGRMVDRALNRRR